MNTLMPVGLYITQTISRLWNGVVAIGLTSWVATLSACQQQHGIMWVVREANVKYERPARLFDELTVSCQVLQVGKVKLVLQQNIYNGEVLLCSATIKLATLDKTSFKLAPMPDTLRTAFDRSL